jgi:hypothetical protein
MFMKLLHAVSIFALTLLSGCATTMEQYHGLVAPSAGKAVVYIYRIDLCAGIDEVAPNVRVNYQNIGPLTKRGYFRVEAKPGSTQLAIFKLDIGDGIFWPVDKDIVLNLDVQPNKTYFLELALNTTSISLTETSREIALQSIPGLHPLN